MKPATGVRNSQLYAWFGGFTLEMLLYMAARASNEQVRRFISLYLTKLRAVVPLLDGDDLRGLGLEPGPLFRRIMDRLIQARLDGEVSSRDEEEAVALSLIRTENKLNNKNR
jgi:tRNA nucleotidyltransferase (CCA-adding enzyme)